jgi:hypothetical protein
MAGPSLASGRPEPAAHGFELGWRQITQALMQAAVVESAEVLHDGELELRSRTPDAVGDQLGPKAVHEALGQRVVEASPTDPTEASTPWSASVWV